MMKKLVSLLMMALATCVACAAVTVTDHPSPFDPQNLPNVTTGNAPVGSPFGRFSLDYGDSQSQSFTLDSTVQLDSLYLGYNDQGVPGEITLSIDAGNDGSYDYVFTNIVLSGLQTDGGDSGPVHYLQFDLSSENIELEAGQHKYYFEATLENGAQANGTDFIIAPIRNTTDTYAGGESSILYNNGPTDATFAITGQVVIRGSAYDLAPAGTIDKDTVANQLTWVSGDVPDDPNLTVNGFDILYYSKPTASVTADDPNFANTANGVVTVPNATSPYALTFDYNKTYFWRVDSHVTWDSNDITGFYTDIIPSRVQTFTTLADDLPPVVTAGQNVITWLGNLPEPGLAATVSDEQIASAVIDWDIIAGPGIAPNTAKQSLQRNAYTGDPSYNNLIQDWIGTDARTGTYTMYLTLSGLPNGTYSWTSYHHDSEDQTGLFDLAIDGVAYASNPVDISNGADLPFDPNVTKVNATITADGISDVVLAFTQQADDPTNQAFFVMNGFELTDGGVTPLMVDFGNNAATLQAGFEDYTAGHEVSADFVPKDYAAFGTTVTVTPGWDSPTAQVIDTTTDNAAPTARFETLTNDLGTYTIQLTATDTASQSDSDTLTVTVAADACAAAKEVTGFALNYYDRDGDCDVDLEDFATFAQSWLDDKNLDGTVSE